MSVVDALGDRNEQKTITMPESQILIFEKRARWRPSLQRELAETPIAIRAFGSLKELQAAAGECQTQRVRCVAVLDLNSALSSVLQFLAATQAQLPDFASVVIGSGAHAVLEPTLRELGATSFHQLPVRRDRLAIECRKLLRVP